MPNSDDLEMLGSLKDSTIARLLVCGKLPLDGREPSPASVNLTSEEVSESFPSQVQKDSERVCQELTPEMASLTQAQTKLRSGAIMRCRYCPFGASDARTMYSHYKFHEQVLCSQSAASRSHIEWMVAYRQQKWGGEALPGTPAWASPTRSSEIGFQMGCSDDNYEQSVSPRQSPSASNCLRSIVQSTRQNSPDATGRATETRTTPSPLTIGVASPIDTGSRGESPILSPGLSTCSQQRYMPIVIKVEPDDYNRTRPTSCEVTPAPMSPRAGATSRSDTWTVGRGAATRSPPHRVICRLMPRVMSNTTPMLRAMLGKRRRTASLSNDASVAPSDSSDGCKSPLTTMNDTASQCDGHSVRPPQDDAAVQCDLLAGYGDEPAALPGRYSSARLRCLHCGISFDDEVLHSLHMGCHSHRDPFICNVCGRSCNDRYAFYTHIMRGHQST